MLRNPGITQHFTEAVSLARYNLRKKYSSNIWYMLVRFDCTWVTNAMYVNCGISGRKCCMPCRQCLNYGAYLSADQYHLTIETVRTYSEMIIDR